MRRHVRTSHFSIVHPVLACLVLLVVSIGCGNERPDTTETPDTPEATMPEPPEDSSITIGSGGTVIAGQGTSSTASPTGTLSPLMFGTFPETTSGTNCTQCYSFSYANNAYTATGFTIANGTTTFTASVEDVTVNSEVKSAPAYSFDDTSLVAYDASSGECRKVPAGLRNMLGANAATTTVTPTSPIPALPPNVTSIPLADITIDYTIEVTDAVASDCGLT